jgi:Fur family peroxide stress response transcriptional regulator
MKLLGVTGLRLTPQRLAIFEYLNGNTSHPSAEDIYDEVKKKYPMMSFATVYKTLQALKQRGDILELTIDQKRRRYDPYTGSHHHLICIGCRKIIDIHEDFQINISDNAKGPFEVIGTRIEFYGICPGCKSERRS